MAKRKKKAAKKKGRKKAGRRWPVVDLL